MATATNRTVDRAELVEFLRPRHRLILATRRADGAVEGLVDYYRAVSGEHPDWNEYRQAMVDQGKCLVRLRVARWGPIATGGFPPELARD